MSLGKEERTGKEGPATGNTAACGLGRRCRRRVKVVPRRPGPSLGRPPDGPRRVSDGSLVGSSRANQLGSSRRAPFLPLSFPVLVLTDPLPSGPLP